MMKRIAFYCQDTGDREDTADIQWQSLHLATQGEDVQIVRNYLDHRDFARQRRTPDRDGPVKGRDERDGYRVGQGNRGQGVAAEN